MSRTLSADALSRAESFLSEQARPLEQAKWAWAKGEGDADAVRTALATFQHPDGGFGHALEPDAFDALGAGVTHHHGVARFDGQRDRRKGGDRRRQLGLPLVGAGAQ